jgi:hypothetical protein
LKSENLLAVSVPKLPNQKLPSQRLLRQLNPSQEHLMWVDPLKRPTHTEQKALLILEQLLQGNALKRRRQSQQHPLLLRQETIQQHRNKQQWASPQLSRMHPKLKEQPRRSQRLSRKIRALLILLRALRLLWMIHLFVNKEFRDYAIVSAAKKNA